MGGVELMDVKIISNEQQNRLFEATVEQFTRDLCYLRGAMDTVFTEVKSTRYVSEATLLHITEHLRQMQESLDGMNYKLAMEMLK